MSEYKTTINAPREKVWKVLWDDASYRQWSTAFMPGSHAESDWNEGSKILFLGPDKSGMTSVIAAKKDNQFMSFKHLGIVTEGVEDKESEEAKKWGNSTESYTLKDVGGKTELTVNFEGNIPAEFVAEFEKAWPKALDKIKELSEQGETQGR